MISTSMIIVPMMPFAHRPKVAPPPCPNGQVWSAVAPSYRFPMATESRRPRPPKAVAMRYRTSNTHTIFTPSGGFGSDVVS